jgi:hypothetical protein
LDSFGRFGPILLTGKNRFLPVLDIVLDRVVFTKRNPANWLMARSLCLSSGLELAMYRNMAEYSFVKNNLVDDGSAGFWIGYEVKGEFNHKPSSFVGQDGTDFPNFLNFQFLSSHWLCPYLNIRGDNHFTDFCVSGQHFSLCQFISEEN